MTLVPNSSLGIQNTSSLLRIPCHLRMPTVRDGERPHVVEAGPRIDQRWLKTVLGRASYNSFRLTPRFPEGLHRRLMSPISISRLHAQVRDGRGRRAG